VVFQFMVAPAFELGQRVALEKVGADGLARGFPGGGLGAARTEFEGVRIGRLGPGAADAGEAIGLVLLEQQARVFDDDVLVGQDRADVTDRAPAAGWHRRFGNTDLLFLFAHCSLPLME
jgi:hypothetical protein